MNKEKLYALIDERKEQLMNKSRENLIKCLVNFTRENGEMGAEQIAMFSMFESNLFAVELLKSVIAELKD